MAQSNINACISRVAARGRIGQAEARDILDAVYNGAEDMRQTGQKNPVVTAAWRMAQQLKDDARQKRIGAIRNARIRQARIAEAKAAGGVSGAAHQIRSRLFWTAGGNPNGNAETLGKSIAHSWLSVMHAQLQKGGFLKVASDPKNFVEIAKAIGEVRGIPGATAAAGPFRDIAQVLRPVQEAIRARLNQEGARIANAHDWIAHTSHDALLLRRGGRGQVPEPNADAAFKRWRDHVLPRLDAKTFDDVQPRPGDLIKPAETQAQANDRFLRSVWNTLVDGIHLRTGMSLTKKGLLPTGASQWEMPGGNFAKRLSESRLLLFKGPTEWAEYMQMYGAHRNWYSLMTAAAQRAGRDAGLMHFWGDNPANNLRLVQQKIAEDYHLKGDVDSVQAFEQEMRGGLTQPNVDLVMSHLDGSASQPQSEMWHTIGRTARMLLDIKFLGAVSITHAASLVSTFPSEARLHGIGTLRALGNAVKAMVPSHLSGADRAERLSLLGAYADGAVRYAHDPLSQGGNFPGYVAATHNRFMQATGLPYLFDHARWGMREMLSHNLARLSGKSFADLPPTLARVLQRYGIDDQTWAKLRPDITANGRQYMTPRAGLAISRDVADGLAMYFHDASEHATVAVGVREAAMLRGNIAPGSWQDEILSSLMQFKTWPIAAMHQVIGREIYSSLTRGKAVLGVGAVVGLSMLGGYLRMVARDMVTGTEPRTPRNPADAAKIALASLAQGGGLGIFGDFLFGEANRMGGGVGSTLGGPMVSEFAQLYDIYNQYLQSLGTDRKVDVWPELARWAVGHIPLGNLFYLKGAADYLFYYHVFEALHPGWWDHLNRRMKKEQGRTMVGYTPGGRVPWGVPGVYLNSGSHASGLFGGG